MTYFQDWQIEPNRALSLHGALTQRIEVYSGTAWITYAHDSRDFFLTRDQSLRLERDNAHIVVESLCSDQPLRIRTYIRESASLSQVTQSFARAMGVSVRHARVRIAHVLTKLAGAIEPVCTEVCAARPQ